MVSANRNPDQGHCHKQDRFTGLTAVLVLRCRAHLSWLTEEWRQGDTSGALDALYVQDAECQLGVFFLIRDLKLDDQASPVTLLEGQYMCTGRCVGQHAHC